MLRILVENKNFRYLWNRDEDLVEELMRDIAKVKLSLEREGYLRVEPDEIIQHLINIG